MLDNDLSYGEKVASILTDYIKEGKKLVSPVITSAEYLILPYRKNNLEKEMAFFDFPSGCEINLFPIDMQVAKKAAAIRAEYLYF